MDEYAITVFESSFNGFGLALKNSEIVFRVVTV